MASWKELLVAERSGLPAAARNVRELSERDVAAEFSAFFPKNAIISAKVIEQGVDGALLLEASESDLQLLGLAGFSLKKMQNVIKALQAQQDAYDKEPTGLAAATKTDAFGALPNDPASWSIEDVSQWLRKSGLADMVDVFSENEVDGQSLVDLVQDDLEHDMSLTAAQAQSVLNQRAKLIGPGIDGDNSGFGALPDSKKAEAHSSAAAIVADSAPVDVRSWDTRRVLDWLRPLLSGFDSATTNTILNNFQQSSINGRSLVELVELKDLRTDLMACVGSLQQKVIMSQIVALRRSQASFDMSSTTDSKRLEQEDQEHAEMISQNRIKQREYAPLNVRKMSTEELRQWLRQHQPEAICQKVTAGITGDLFMTFKAREFYEMKIEHPLQRKALAMLVAELQDSQNAYDAQLRQESGRSTASPENKDAGAADAVPEDVNSWDRATVQRWVETTLFPNAATDERQLEHLRKFQSIVTSASVLWRITNHDLEQGILPRATALERKVLLLHIDELRRRQRAFDEKDKVAAGRSKKVTDKVRKQAREQQHSIEAQDVRAWDHAKAMEWLNDVAYGQEQLHDAMRACHMRGPMLAGRTKDMTEPDPVADGETEAKAEVQAETEAWLIYDDTASVISSGFALESFLLGCERLCIAQHKHDKSLLQQHQEVLPAENIGAWKPAQVKDWLDALFSEPTEVQRQLISCLTGISGHGLLELSRERLVEEVSALQQDPFSCIRLLSEVESLKIQQNGFMQIKKAEAEEAAKRQQEQEEKDKADQAAIVELGKQYPAFGEMEEKYRKATASNPDAADSFCKRHIKRWQDLDVFHWLINPAKGHEESILRMRYLVVEQGLKGTDLANLARTTGKATDLSLNGSDISTTTMDFINYCKRELKDEDKQQAPGQDLKDENRQADKLLDKLRQAIRKAMEMQPQLTGGVDVENMRAEEIKDKEITDCTNHKRTGAGSFKEVIKARYKNRNVVQCKFLPTKDAGDGNAKEKADQKLSEPWKSVKAEVYDKERAFDLKREIYMLSRVQGPGVVELLGYCFDSKDVPYFVTEYLPCTVQQEYILSKQVGDTKSIFSARNKDNLDVKGTEGVRLQQIRVAAATAEALAHMHERGVLHLDIAGRNVMLDARKRPRLIDMGRALLIEDAKERHKLRQESLERLTWQDVKEDELKIIRKDPCSDDARLLRQLHADVAKAPWKCLPREACDENPVFNEFTDVYMFGMFMYEIVAMEMPYQNMTDKDVSSLKQGPLESSLPILSVPTDDEYASIMRKCWLGRMTMKEVANALHTRYRELCNMEHKDADAPVFYRGTAASAYDTAPASQEGPAAERRHTRVTQKVQVERRVDFDFSAHGKNVRMENYELLEQWKTYGETDTTLLEYINHFTETRDHSGVESVMLIVKLVDRTPVIDVIEACMQSMGQLAEDVHSNVDRDVIGIAECVLAVVESHRHVKLSSAHRIRLLTASLNAMSKLLGALSGQRMDEKMTLTVTDMAVDALEEIDDDLELLIYACDTISSVLASNTGSRSYDAPLMHLHNRRVVLKIVRLMEKMRLTAFGGDSERQSEALSFMSAGSAVLASFPAHYVVIMEEDVSKQAQAPAALAPAVTADSETKEEHRQAKSAVARSLFQLLHMAAGLDTQPSKRVGNYVMTGDHREAQLSFVAELLSSLHEMCRDCHSNNPFEEPRLMWFLSAMEQPEVRLLLSMLVSYDEQWQVDLGPRLIYRVRCGALGLLRYAVYVERFSLQGHTTRVDYMCAIDPQLEFVTGCMTLYRDPTSVGFDKEANKKQYRAGAVIGGQTSMAAGTAFRAAANAYGTVALSAASETFQQNFSDNMMQLASDQFEDGDESNITWDDVARIQENCAAIIGWSCYLLSQLRSSIAGTETAQMIVRTVRRFSNRQTTVKEALLALSNVTRCSVENTRRLLGQVRIVNVMNDICHRCTRIHGKSSSQLTDVVGGCLQLLLAIMQPHDGLIQELKAIRSRYQSQDRTVFHRTREQLLMDQPAYQVVDVLTKDKKNLWSHLYVSAEWALRGENRFAVAVGDFLSFLTCIAYWKPDMWNAWLNKDANFLKDGTLFKLYEVFLAGFAKSLKTSGQRLGLEIDVTVQVQEQESDSRSDSESESESDTEPEPGNKAPAKVQDIPTTKRTVRLRCMATRGCQATLEINTLWNPVGNSTMCPRCKKKFSVPKDIYTNSMAQPVTEKERNILIKQQAAAAAKAARNTAPAPKKKKRKKKVKGTATVNVRVEKQENKADTQLDTTDVDGKTESGGATKTTAAGTGSKSTYSSGKSRALANDERERKGGEALADAKEVLKQHAAFQSGVERPTIFHFLVMCLHQYQWPSLDSIRGSEQRMHAAASVHAAALPMLTAMLHQRGQVPHNYVIGDIIMEHKVSEHELNLRSVVMDLDLLQTCSTSIKFGRDYLHTYPGPLLVRHALWIIAMLSCEEDASGRDDVLSESELTVSELIQVMETFKTSRSILCLCLVLIKRIHRVNQIQTLLNEAASLQNWTKWIIKANKDDLLTMDSSTPDVFTMGSDHYFQCIGKHAVDVLNLLTVGQSESRIFYHPRDIHVIQVKVDMKLATSDDTFNAFELDVEWSPSDKMRWSVWRRRDEFQELYAQLLQQGITGLAPLPGGSHIRDSKALRRFGKELQEWLKKANCVSGVRHSEAYQIFVGALDSENRSVYQDKITLPSLQLSEVDFSLARAKLSAYSVCCCTADTLDGQDVVFAALFRIGKGLFSSANSKIAVWRDGTFLFAYDLGVGAVPMWIKYLRQGSALRPDDGRQCYAITVGFCENQALGVNRFTLQWDPLTNTRSINKLGTSKQMSISSGCMSFFSGGRMTMIAEQHATGLQIVIAWVNKKWTTAGYLTTGNQSSTQRLPSYSYSFHIRDSYMFLGGVNKVHFHSVPTEGIGKWDTNKPRNDLMKSPVRPLKLVQDGVHMDVQVVHYVDHLRCLLVLMSNHKSTTFYAAYIKDIQSYMNVPERDIHHYIERLELPGFASGSSVACMMLLCAGAGPLWDVHYQGSGDAEFMRAVATGSGDPARDVSYLVVGLANGVFQIWRLPNKVLCNIIQRNKLKQGFKQTTSKEERKAVENDYNNNGYPMELVVSKTFDSTFTSMAWHEKTKSVLLTMRSKSAINRLYVGGIVPDGFICPGELKQHSIVVPRTSTRRESYYFKDANTPDNLRALPTATVTTATAIATVIPNATSATVTTATATATGETAVAPGEL